MTEIPSTCSKRSRERREALGLRRRRRQPGQPRRQRSARPPTVQPAGCGRDAGAHACTRSRLRGRRAAAQAPAALRRGRTPRKRIPFWAMPVVALLPLWAFIYQWSLTPPAKAVTGPLAAGQGSSPRTARRATRRRRLAGGVGFQLSNGSVLQTFPDIEDQSRS